VRLTGCGMRSEVGEPWGWEQQQQQQQQQHHGAGAGKQGGGGSGAGCAGGSRLGSPKKKKP
jgi:hypothetical protein